MNRHILYVCAMTLFISFVGQILPIDVYDVYKKSKTVGARSAALAELYSKVITSRSIRTKVLKDPEFKVGKQPTLAKVRTSILRKIAILADEAVEKVRADLSAKQQSNMPSCHSLKFGERSHVAQERIEAVGRECATLRAQLDAEQRRVTDRDNEIVALRRECDERLQHGREHAQQLIAEREQQTQERERTAQQRIDGMEHDVEVLREQLAVAQHRLEELETELDMVRRESAAQVQAEREHAQQLIAEHDQQAVARENIARERFVALNADYAKAREVSVMLQEERDRVQRILVDEAGRLAEQQQAARERIAALENELAAAHEQAEQAQVRDEDQKVREAGILVDVLKAAGQVPADMRAALFEQLARVIPAYLAAANVEKDLITDELQARLRVQHDELVAEQQRVVSEMEQKFEAKQQGEREARLRVDDLQRQLDAKNTIELERDAAREMVGVVRQNLEDRMMQQTARFDRELKRIMQEKVALEDTLRLARGENIDLRLQTVRRERFPGQRFEASGAVKIMSPVEAPACGRMPLSTSLGIGGGISSFGRIHGDMLGSCLAGRDGGKVSSILASVMGKRLASGLPGLRIGVPTVSVDQPRAFAKFVSESSTAVSHGMVNPFLQVTKGSEILRNLPAPLREVPLVKQALALSTHVVGKAPSEVCLSRVNIETIERILPEISANGHITISDRLIGTQRSLDSDGSLPAVRPELMYRAKQALTQVFSGLVGITSRFAGSGHLLG